MMGRGAGLGGFSATLIEHVDEVCDRFEAAWKDGSRPRIEDYLDGEIEPGRSVLVRELLTAELEWRKRLGEDPERSDYLVRLAPFGPVVEAVFEATPALSGSASERGRDDPARPEGGALSPGGPRFHILRRHAEGGLGVVFVARDEELHREVALKEIQPRLASRPEVRARFLLEAEINGSLEHPGIAPVYSLGRHEDGRPFYAMRLIHGASLKEAIAEFHQGGADRREPGSRSLALRKLLDRFRDACNTLAYAHSRGVLHRDVKPHNIMVGRFGETILLDWGLAKATGLPDALISPETPPLRPGGSGGSDVTADGSTLGTPAYMSPEQAEGRVDGVGVASDIYGLGATLYHLLTGQPPFEGGAADILARVRRGEFPGPRAVKPDIHRALDAVCRKAMATRPEDRYRTAMELAEDIERWQADEPVAAWREPWTTRARRWMTRHRTFVIATVAAFMLTAIVLGGCVLAYCFDRFHIGPIFGHDHSKMIERLRPVHGQ